MIEKLTFDPIEKSQILEQNETPYLECCHKDIQKDKYNKQCCQEKFNEFGCKAHTLKY